MSPATMSHIPARRLHSNRDKGSSSIKVVPFAYTPWRTPLSDRQMNNAFESQIMPGLKLRLEHAFVDLAVDEREDAVQDATCQALEAYKLLRLGESLNRSYSAEDTVFALAAFASARYQNGVRFAAPRSVSLP